MRDDYSAACFFGNKCSYHQQADSGYGSVTFDSIVATRIVYAKVDSRLRSALVLLSPKSSYF